MGEKGISRGHTSWWSPYTLISHGGVGQPQRALTSHHWDFTVGARADLHICNRAGLEDEVCRDSEHHPTPSVPNLSLYPAGNRKQTSPKFSLTNANCLNPNKCFLSTPYPTLPSKKSKDQRHHFCPASWRKLPEGSLLTTPHTPDRQSSSGRPEGDRNLQVE